MYTAYPKWIPKSGTNADAFVEHRIVDKVTKEVTIGEKLVEQIQVKDEKTHKEKNMEHFLFEQSSKPAAPMSVNEAQATERERAAMVAERFPGGYLVAAAIRATVPTIQEVIGAGYDPKMAASIVIEEKRKYDSGEPPYGPELPVPVLAQPASVPSGLPTLVPDPKDLDKAAGSDAQQTAE